MKFIENNEKYGIKYDLNKIASEYKKLKVPVEFDLIDFKRFENSKYIIDLSQRTIGKTTDYLILGMVFNKIYGTQICYIREKHDMIKASLAEKLTETLVKYKDGYYIKQLTNGKYNSVFYKWQKLYYCLVSETGERVEVSNEPFLIFMSIDLHEQYKSTINNPLLDFIIFDEFISRYYTQDSCFMFMDLLSTVIRKRKSPYIIMLANNININSPWFEELTIGKQVRKLNFGETIEINSDMGTKFSIRMIKEKNLKERQEHNKLFFGINNPKLSSITGNNNWSVRQVQHIYKNMKYDKLLQPIFIFISANYYLRMDFAEMENDIVLIVTKSKKILEDDIVFTLKDYCEKNEYFGLCNDRIENKVKELLRQNKVYYATNEIGEDFLNYCYRVFNRKYL